MSRKTMKKKESGHKWVKMPGQGVDQVTVGGVTEWLTKLCGHELGHALGQIANSWPRVTQITLQDGAFGAISKVLKEDPKHGRQSIISEGLESALQEPLSEVSSLSLARCFTQRSDSSTPFTELDTTAIISSNTTPTKINLQTNTWQPLVP